MKRQKVKSRSKYGGNLEPWLAIEKKKKHLIATIKSSIYLIFTKVSFPLFLPNDNTVLIFITSGRL